MADGKPVVLHVLHSWGGGVDYFARDLQAGDRGRTHLFLKSHSRDSLPPFGKELSLYRDLDQEPIASWHLASPIMDTETHSEEVVRILQSIIEKWTVGAVIVSSLIGHGIDVLRTGLPTALAVHDVYPFWPLLHDANTDDYSRESLDRALIDGEATNIFASHGADYWIAIRDELTGTVLRESIACIAPSEFAKERVCRIDPRLRAAHWSVIPHGLEKIAINGGDGNVGRPGHLKVLVPGHINGGKGEILLKELVPVLPGGIEIVMLGSAHLGPQFAFENVTIIDHYKRTELAEIVAGIRPDVALLASTVPETYGYVLSEMLQLGVPVLCSDLGAYAERGKNSPGVTLVSPNVASFLDALVAFRDDPDLLSKQRQGLPLQFPSLEDMAKAWALALPARSPQWKFEFTDDPCIGNEVMMNLQLTHLSELLKAVHAATEQNSKSGNEALECMKKQQASIESLLESSNLQSRQMAAMLSRQNELEASLINKNEEIASLSSRAVELENAFQQQLVLAGEQKEAFKAMLENLKADSESKVTSILESANRDRQDFGSRLTELSNSISALNEELLVMKSGRGWRFLTFFK